MLKIQPSRIALERKLLWLYGKTQTRELHGKSETDVAKAFRKKGQDWLALPENKDGAHIKPQSARTAYYACQWFDNAVKLQNHDDSTVRRNARKTCKCALHLKFPEIVERLIRLRTQAIRANKRLAKRHFEAAELMREAEESNIELGDGFDLQELRSVRHIQKIGQTLENCAANHRCACDYAMAVRDGLVEFWAFRENKSPIYLIEISTQSREIVQIEGKSKSFPRLERSLVFRIQDALDIRGGDDRLFIENGALEAFRFGVPPAKPLKIGSSIHWIWMFSDTGEVIIATQDDQGSSKYWSQFKRTKTDDGTDAANQLWDLPAQDSVAEAGYGWYANSEWNHLTDADLHTLTEGDPEVARLLLSEA